MSANTFIDNTYSTKNGISGSTLKLIAIITMFIDHIGASVLESSAAYPYAFSRGEAFYSLFRISDLVLRLIGRIAFPIFCFLLVEGFLHTRDVKKYALRLGIFCLISEIPFDLAFSGRFFATGHQNVFFTLLIGLLVLVGIRRFEGSGAFNMIGRILCFAAGAAIARILRTDYDAFGVCVIMLFYLFRNRPLLRDITAMLALIACSPLEITGVIALIPIHLYNGKRGSSVKYFFYLFYPIHLLLLYGVGQLLFSVIL